MYLPQRQITNCGTVAISWEKTYSITPREQNACTSPSHGIPQHTRNEVISLITAVKAMVTLTYSLSALYYKGHRVQYSSETLAVRHGKQGHLTSDLYLTPSQCILHNCTLLLAPREPPDAARDHAHGDIQASWLGCSSLPRTVHEAVTTPTTSVPVIGSAEDVKRLGIDRICLNTVKTGYTGNVIQN